ncbi:MAG: ribosome maturation factor RimM [Flavobacteriales bacterium]
MEYTKIGVIIKPHGLKGEVAVKSEPGIVGRYTEFKSIFLSMGGTYVPYIIESQASLNKDKLKLKLSGLNSASDAEMMRGNELFQLTKLLGVEKQMDLTGFSIILESGFFVGVIDEVIENQAQVLLAVLRNDDEVLIPLVDDFIVAVDSKKRQITLDLPEGLLDL